jgi:hypothetical protein
MRDRLIEADRSAAASTSLFGDLLDEWTLTVPPMPPRLRRFDTVLSHATARQEALQALAIWLSAPSVQAVLRDQFDVAPRPCSDPAVIESFVPDFPDVDDWDGDADSDFFLLEVRLAEIDRALAKRVCATECPVRAMCLARAIHADGRNYVEFDFDEYAVLGGWGPSARRKILNKFDELRRSYLRGGLEEADIHAARTPPLAMSEAIAEALR